MPSRYFRTGVPVFDYLIGDTAPGLYIQVVGGPDSNLTQVAMNFTRAAKHPVYVDARGDMNADEAKAIMGPDVIVIQPRDDGRHFEVIRETIEGLPVDLVVVDNLPSIVSPDEEHDSGSGPSIHLIAQALLEFRTICSQRRITMVFVNHLRDRFKESGSRIYGGNVLTKKMDITLAVVPKQYITRGKGDKIGQEMIFSVMYGSHEIAQRKAVAGLLNPGILDDAYWAYFHGRRLGLLKVSDAGVVKYDGIHFRHKWLFMDEMANDNVRREKLLLAIWEGMNVQG